MSVTWLVSAAVCQGNVVVQFLLAKVERTTDCYIQLRSAVDVRVTKPDAWL